jgi:hypothetical protein
MGFGQTLRMEAAAHTGKRAVGRSGPWSIVMTAPGFMNGLIKDWWLTAKHRGPEEPTPEDRMLLRKIVSEAGGDGASEPQHPVWGTSLWRWPPTETDDTTPAETTDTRDDKPIIDPENAPDIEMQRVGRNDPCPCGSSKKFKKCCLGKQPRNVVGVCQAPVGDLGSEAGAGNWSSLCGKPGISAFYCKLCGRQYGWCGDDKHKDAAQTMLNGHVIRNHPEMIPAETLDKWLGDPEWMAMLEEQRRNAPDLWAKFFEHVEQRKRERSGDTT